MSLYAAAAVFASSGTKRLNFNVTFIFRMKTKRLEQQHSSQQPAVICRTTF